MRDDNPKDAYALEAPPLIKSPEPEISIRLSRERPTLIRKSHNKILDPKTLMRKFRESAQSAVRDSASQANPQTPANLNISVFSKNVLKIKKRGKRGGLLDMNMLNKSTEFQGSLTSKGLNTS